MKAIKKEPLKEVLFLLKMYLSVRVISPSELAHEPTSLVRGRQKKLPLTRELSANKAD